MVCNKKVIAIRIQQAHERQTPYSLHRRRCRDVGEDIGFSPGERLEEQVHQGLCRLHDGFLPYGRLQAQSQPGNLSRGKLEPAPMCRCFFRVVRSARAPTAKRNEPL